MKWKKVENGKYRRTCTACTGKGYVEHDPRWSLHCCIDYYEKIDHPVNSDRGSPRYWAHLMQELVICGICSRVWLFFSDLTGDSIDIPNPLYVGDQIPEDDWQPQKV